MSKRNYIQKGSDARKDLLDTYGISIKSIPFKAFQDLKDFPKREWAEFSGDDEFIPSNPIFKAYELDLALNYIGLLDSAKDAIYSMLQYSQGAEFNLWDEWKRVGLRARYVSYSDNSFYRRETDTLEFSIKLKVNNPLSYGIKLDTGSFVATAGCNLTIYWADGTSTSYVTNDIITKTIATGNEFAIISPDKMGLIDFGTFSYPAMRFITEGGMRLLSPVGVRYIKQ